MKPDTDDFEVVARGDHITKYVREVDTPAEGGDAEENNMTIYEVGEHLVKVAKISTLGWSVTHYPEDAPLRRHTPRLDDESNAHEVAKEFITEVL